MPRRRKYSQPPQPSALRRHLCQASITRQTVSRYLSAMNSFFVWRKARRLCANPTFSVLDLQLAEYINYLYQNEMPLYLGTTCIAGFKKFQPRCKRHIDTACTWLGNWAKIASKVQAMPLHPKLVKAFMAYGMLRKDPDFTVALYVGFLALLRGCEIANLMLVDCQERGPGQMTLVLRGTKGARIRGVPFETVVIKDPDAIKMLIKLKASGRTRLYRGRSDQFAKTYKDAVSFFRVKHPKPTPHGIRRGWGGFVAFQAARAI